MWPRTRQWSVVALIFAGLGCQHHSTSVNTKQPPDPLLISKKPVEGKPSSFTRSTAWPEPHPPAAPAPDAVVQKPGPAQPIPASYRPTADAGAAIGRPGWLPDGQ
jgi:hypothetical protein